jgi:multiple sugar transport system permease protein
MASIETTRRAAAAGSMSRRLVGTFGSDNVVGYLFILPAIVGFSVFVVYPLISSVYYSMTDWNGLTAPSFVGLDNYAYMFFKDPAFRPSLVATGVYVLCSVPTSLALGLLLAVLMNRNLPGVRILRTVLYLPVVLPLVAAVSLFKFVYDPQLGLANEVLHMAHLPPVLWLSDARTVFPSIATVAVWRVGSSMIIFLAALQGVPAELYEAARIDGAGALRTFFGVTLPMITPILFLQLVLLIVSAMQAFVEPMLMPAAGFSPNLLMVSVYRHGFGNLGQFPELGYATAEALVLFVMVMIVSAFTFRFSRMWVYSEEGGR